MDMRGATHVQGKDVLFQVRVIASLCGSHVYRDTTRLIVHIVRFRWPLLYDRCASELLG